MLMPATSKRDIWHKNTVICAAQIRISLFKQVDPQRECRRRRQLFATNLAAAGEFLH